MDKTVNPQLMNKEQMQNRFFEYIKTENLKKVLDIGCGKGMFISRNPKVIEGLDACERSVNLCRSQGLRCTLGKIEKIPFPDETFDGIQACHIIEHLYPEQLYNGMLEMDRVLKMGGLIAIAAPELYPKFYDTLSHVRPYTYKVFINYMVENTKVQNLLWDRTPGLYELVERMKRPDSPKPGYMIILRKVGKR